MRRSAVAALDDATSFDGKNDQFVSPISSAKFEDKHPLPAPASAEKPPRTAGTDNYGEDSYEDEFADDDEPAIIEARLEEKIEPKSEIMSTFSPMPATDSASAADQNVPILDSPVKPKYGSSKRSSSDGASGSPDRSVKSPSVPVVKETVSDLKKDEEEEDNYEDEFDEADSSMRLTGTTAGLNQDSKEPTAATVQPEAEAAPLEPVPEPDSQPEAEPEVELDDADFDLDDDEPKPTPKSSPPSVAAAASFSSPSVKILPSAEVNVDASKQQASAAKRAQTPGDAEDDYGADDFDDFEDD